MKENSSDVVALEKKTKYLYVEQKKIISYLHFDYVVGFLRDCTNLNTSHVRQKGVSDILIYLYKILIYKVNLWNPDATVIES